MPAAEMLVMSLGGIEPWTLHSETACRHLAISTITISCDYIS